MATKTNKKLCLALLIPLSVALWWIWPSGNESLDLSSVVAENNRARTPTSVLELPNRTDTASPHHSSGRDRENSASSFAVARAEDEIHTILDNDLIDESQAAARLMRIAANRSLPDSVRMQALQHGLLLDLAESEPLSQDPSLPVDLALEILGDIQNANHDPELQIRVYRQSLEHSDEAVKEEARISLQFRVEDVATHLQDLLESGNEAHQDGAKRWLKALDEVTPSEALIESLQGDLPIATLQLYADAMLWFLKMNPEKP